MKSGMARLQKESAKLDGTAILTMTKMESVVTPEQAQARADQPKVGLGGIAGGLGGMFGKKKKAEEAPKEGQAAAAAPSNRATVLTTTTELLGVETSVAAADVELPAGFKQK
jgi:hypothetical protein